MSSFYHAGDVGDLIYGLAVIRKLGGGSLFVGERTALGHLQPRRGITQDILAYVASFLNQQPCVREVRWQSRPPFVTHDLNGFRRYWSDQPLPPRANGTLPHLLEMHFNTVGQPCDWTPWLMAGMQHEAPVVLSRSARQQSPIFPWQDVVEKYNTRCVFLGLPDEYDAFARTYGPVRYVRTHSLEHVASIINAARLVVCNSTSALAVALGLGKPVIQELPKTQELAHTASCVPYCIDVLGDKVILPAI